MNKRRKLVIVLGAGALVVPLACFAQRPDRVWRVGFLSARSRPVSLDSDDTVDSRRGCANSAMSRART